MSKINTDDIRKTFKGYEAAGEHGFRHFAILVPILQIRAKDQCTYEPQLLYEVRAAKLDRQPGEICFPGGLIEPRETPLQAALRETEEEVGIPREDIEIAAKLDSVYSTSGSQIHCYLGIIRQETSTVINRDEVAEIFTVAIDELMKTAPEIFENRLVQEPDPDFPYERVTAGKMYPWRTGISPVPVYDVKDTTGKSRIIWGLTGRITKQFIEILNEGSKTHY